MTLLLATVTERDILVTGDGLSCATGLRDAPGRSTLQKIFPIPSHAAAIAQCGPSFLKVRTGKISLQQWLGCFFQKLDASDVISIAQCVRKEIQSDEVEEDEKKQFFNRNAYLWVMGYSVGRTSPEFLCVSRNGVRNLLDGEDLPYKAITGAGADFLIGCEWRDHDEAWHQALKRQEQRDKPVFGGHMHQLRITYSGCGWAGSHEPMHGTLGLETTLNKWGVRIPVQVDCSDPRCRILSLRKDLVEELCHRALTDKGKHPRTYGGAKDHWRAGPEPNWDLTDQLVAASDDAELADSADVSQGDARLYEALVQRVRKPLPRMVHPAR